MHKQTHKQKNSVWYWVLTIGVLTAACGSDHLAAQESARLTAAELPPIDITATLLEVID